MTMPTTAEWTKVCVYGGCGRTFTVEIRPGRQPEYCPQHRGVIWRQRQYSDVHREELNRRERARRAETSRRAREVDALYRAVIAGPAAWMVRGGYVRAEDLSPPSASLTR